MAKGTLVGGRFQIEDDGRSDALGHTWLARDQKTRKPIAIYVLGPTVAADKAAYEAFREEMRVVAKLKHRGLVAIYGVGTHAGREHFIAREWVAGQTLAELSEERARSQQLLSVRGCYNVIAHTCKALTAMHEVTCHGAVRPSVVWVTKTGRVKLGDLGLGLALVKSRRWTLLPPEEQAFLAPEVKAGGMPDARSDVFGVGALLYVLLTGRSPTMEFAAPSQVHPDATPELDAILLRCLATDPAQRFATPDDVVKALLPLTAATPEPEGIEFGANMEIDVDIAVSLAPPAPAESAGPIQINVTAPAAMPGRAAPPATTPALPPMRPQQAPQPQKPGTASAQTRNSPPLTPAAAAPTPAPQAHAVDIAALTAQLTKNDAPRWMAVKDGMDHGPFTARELIKAIVDGEILEDHALFNMSTNERKKVREYPEFGEFVAQYKIRKEEREHQAALERSTKVEKRSTAAKFTILSAAIGAVLIVGAGYFMSRQAAKKREQAKELDLAALYESGQVKISGTAGILHHTPRAGGARRSSGGGPGGFSSYEDAMNQAMELGDATKGGGERQLTSADVAGIMNRNLNRMFACVSDELRQGGKLGKVTIDIAILGSGKVMGASVNTGSPGFQRCMAAKVQSVSFPAFPAPRMGARYSFNVD